VSAKIDLPTAETIRRLYRAGTPGKILAWRFGLNKSTISMIVNDRIWSSAPPSPTPGPGDGIATCSGNHAEGGQ
jgi:hypothetical protein